MGEGGASGAGGSGRGCRCVFPIPDYRPPPHFLHQISSTSWSNLFLLSCIALHCESTGGKSVGYKADTFNWSNWGWVQLQKLDDPILRSNGSRRDSIQDSLVFQDRAQTCFSWHPEISLHFYV